MITLEHDRLVFRFPQVHEDAECSMGFQRTLRIPDNGKDFALPPGLGEFPLRHLDDHQGRAPENWRRRGGVIMPMHQSEAMWVAFGGQRWQGGYPFAVKIATGKINAVSGEKWSEHLNRDPQDYVVIPDQPWLDGYCVERGIMRQGGAVPGGEGCSVEEQLTGSAEWGGMQIVVYPLKAEIYRKRGLDQKIDSVPMMDMGLAPGGRMRQEVYEDRFDLADWDQRHASRCFVTIVNSVAWLAVTGERPPNRPPTAADYTKAGLPWFEYYGGDGKALEGAETLAKAKSVLKTGAEKGEQPLPENEDTETPWVVKLGKKDAGRLVREPSA